MPCLSLDVPCQNIYIYIRTEHSTLLPVFFLNHGVVQIFTFCSGIYIFTDLYNFFK